MAYCRFGSECHVYVFADIRGGWTCCSCLLDGHYNADSRTEMVDHLLRHREAGHAVPERAILRLRSECDE